MYFHGSVGPQCANILNIRGVSHLIYLIETGINLNYIDGCKA